MKKNLLYFRVQNRLIGQVLESGLILPHSIIETDRQCICMTRNVVYMSRSRPFVIVFDRDKIKQYHKIEPFCLSGYKVVNKILGFERWKDTISYESEERVYGGPISLGIAEWYGYLYSGCHDYRNPKLIHLNRLYLAK